MDPVTASAAAMLTGLVLGPCLPALGSAWVAAGTALVAASTRRGAPVAALAVGLWCGRPAPAGPAFEGPVSFVGIRVGAAGGCSADVALTRVFLEGRWTEAEGRVRVVFPGGVPPAGAEVVGAGRAGPLPRVLPGAPDPALAAAAVGVRTQIAARRVERVGGDLPELIPADRDPTGLLRALVTGDTSGVPAATLDVLRRTGTSHLLSISGFHVGAAAALAAALAARTGRIAGGAGARGLSAPELAVAVGAAWAYTALAAWPIPAERAAATVTAGLAARSRGRITSPGPVVASIGAALALVDPGAPWSASYQLSFGALGGLVLLGPRLSRWVPPTWPWIARSTVGGCIATVGATAGTLPFAAWWFQAVPPWGAVANLVAMPSLGLALVPVAGVAAFAPDPLAAAAAAVGTRGAELVLAALSPLAVAPWTPAVGPVGAIGLAVAVGLCAVRPAIGVALGAAVLAWPRARPDELRITMLDVGQGDAVLLEDPTTRILIDGGRSPHDVVRWLRRSGIRQLDVVVQSHPDLDHARGLVAVVRELSVGQLWAVDLDPTLAAAAITRGVPIRLPPDPLWPTSGATGTNDRSVVLGWGPLLATGDAGREVEVALAGRLGRFPVLKVGHHGSAGATSDALLDAAAPRFALLSVGRDNPYGHPAREVLDRLRRRGVSVFRTDVDGTITVDATSIGWRARGSTRAEVP